MSQLSYITKSGFSSQTEVDQWYAQEYYSLSGPNLTDIMGIGLVPIVNNYQGETVVGYDQSLNAQAGKTLQELYFGRIISYAPSNPNGTDTLEIQLDILGDPSLLSAQLVPVGGGKTQILQLPTALNTTTYTTMKCTVVVRGDFDLLFTMRKTRGSALLMLKNLTFTRLRTLSYLPSEEIITQDVEYRYGFNGIERDDEVKGQGNSYTTVWRHYDARLGKWLSTDPVIHHQFSPYSAFDNNPIYWVDPSGANADWFENDLTGEIIYNSELKKGDESKLGENWNHLGENGMFGKSDVSALIEGGGLQSIESNFDGHVSATGYLDANKAKDFMKVNGYEFKPKESYEDISTTFPVNTILPTGGKVTFKNVFGTRLITSNGYVNIDSDVTKDVTVYDDITLAGGYRTISKTLYSYKNKSMSRTAQALLGLVIKAYEIFGKTYDMEYSKIIETTNTKDPQISKELQSVIGQ